MEPAKRAQESELYKFYNTANELIRDVENDRTKSLRLAKFLGEHKPLSLNEEQIDRLKAICHKYPNLKFVEKIVLKTEKVFQTVAKPRSEVFGHRTYLENIYQHLSPRDLVNLALTTKELGHSAPSFIPSLINSHPHKSMTDFGFKDFPEILRYLTAHGGKLTTLNLGDLKIDLSNLQLIVNACPNLQILTFLTKHPIPDERDSDELNHLIIPYFCELGINIRRLTHLKELTIRNCDLDDKFLEEIKDLENLEKLVIRGVGVSPVGTVTDFGLSILSDFKLLKNLDLNTDFDVTTPDLKLALSKFEHLEDLTMWNFETDDDYEIEDLLTLPNLKTVKNLSFEDDLEDFNCLLDLENLEYLRLYGTPSEANLVVINAHTHLKEIRIDREHDDKEIDFSILSTLEKLSLNVCFISEVESITQMSHLKELEIEYLGIERGEIRNLEFLLSRIETMDNLEKLKLFDYWNKNGQNSLNKFYRQKIAELQERRPNLKIEITEGGPEVSQDT